MFLKNRAVRRVRLCATNGALIVGFRMRLTTFILRSILLTDFPCSITATAYGDFAMLMTIFYVLFFVVGLYVLTATVLLSIARIEKGANGKLILDPNSWHFKVAYPFKRFKILDLVDELREARREKYGEKGASGERYAQRCLVCVIARASVSTR